MFGSDLLRKIRNVAGATSELGSLQLQLYAHEVRESCRNMFVVMALVIAAITLFFAGVVLALIGVVVFLTDAGYSPGAAISITAGSVAVLFIAVAGSAYLLAKRQIQRLSIPNHELKANFACIRDQFLKNMSDGNPSI